MINFHLMKKNVAIIMGGYSSEYDISIKSGEVVYKTLKKEKKLNLFRIITVSYTHLTLPTKA